jgi:hypothetical protein
MLIVELARHLRASGIVDTTFGKSVPIILLEGLYISDQLCASIEQVNPDGQASEYLADWYRYRGGER